MAKAMTVGLLVAVVWLGVQYNKARKETSAVSAVYGELVYEYSIQTGDLIEMKINLDAMRAEREEAISRLAVCKSNFQ